ncbi:MAG: hypothetical protein LBQ83_06055 [Candidatus Margulisbacteria bacterium]|jgi:hypothetical protein|nr:hypothetical protein [Candidatus Margulisiibacteriota bacterium]
MHQKLIAAPDEAILLSDESFDALGWLTTYQVSLRTNYMKDILSVLVPQNDNSTLVTSGLGLNEHQRNPAPRIPVFTAKINFKQLLSTEMNNKYGRFSLKIFAYADGQQNIQLQEIFSCNGQKIPNPKECPEEYAYLRSKFRRQAARLSISADELARNIAELRPPDLLGIIRNIPGLDPGLSTRLYKFALSHSSFQNTLLPRIKNYLAQIRQKQPLLPLPIAAAAALEACANEMLHKGNAVRTIENITYIADCFYGQNITAQKTGVENPDRPLALLAEYFTFEDILQIIQHLPGPASSNLAFISAWEPDFIPQEVKRRSHIIRNDDTRELCSLFDIGFYISDSLVQDFKSTVKRTPRALLGILDGESFKSEQSFITETLFIINTPPELEKFTSAYTEIFGHPQIQKNILKTNHFHERSILLAEIYERIIRRILTHYDDFTRIRETSARGYFRHLLHIFNFQQIAGGHKAVLTAGDISSIKIVLSRVIQKLLENQINIKNSAAGFPPDRP